MVGTAPENSSPQETKPARVNILQGGPVKRRTSFSLSAQADADIAELMRRTRQPLAGNVIADAVRIACVMPPELVSMLLSMLDVSGEEQVKRLCRDFMRENI